MWFRIKQRVIYNQTPTINMQDNGLLSSSKWNRPRRAEWSLKSRIEELLVNKLWPSCNFRCHQAACGAAPNNGANPEITVVFREGKGCED